MKSPVSNCSASARSIQLLHSDASSSALVVHTAHGDRIGSPASSQSEMAFAHAAPPLTTPCHF
eukprot:3664111-Prymnesium_polylepis.1